MTIRIKQDYVLNLKNGVYIPQKVGYKPIQRQDIEYEPDLVFSLNAKHKATVTKNRTGLFLNASEFVITPVIGEQLKKWCNDEVIEKPEEAKTIIRQDSMLDKEDIPHHHPNTINVSLFNFKSHGMQMDGVNYLIPIDADITDKISATENTININDWISKLEVNEKRLNIVILDACKRMRNANLVKI